MNMKKSLMILSVFGLLASASELALAGDAKAGKKVFAKCRACHFVDKDKHKTGPHLVDVIGRTAGDTDFKKYSKAMKESGIVWNDETLDGYLEAPKKYLKGGKMAFAGLKKKKDRDNVIAYLKEFSK